MTSDPNILLGQWDAVVVHGGDVNVQDFVLSNAARIPSPILYLLVLPSNSPICLGALRDCRWIGCSTEADKRHCIAHGVTDKVVQVRHGIRWQNCMGTPGFKQRHGIKGRMFISCGGYWPNKAMRELSDLFEAAGLEDATLVTTGYDNRMDLMPLSRPGIMPLLIDDRSEVLSAIHDADCMIMHSYTEGFGLVLLESMLNQTPWLARHIAGAETLERFGKTYRSDAELVTLLRNFSRSDFDIEGAYNHVVSNRLISNTVDDIEQAVRNG